MKARPTFVALVVAAAVLSGRTFTSAARDGGSYNKIDIEQVPSWSKGDLNFFLHGSMSTEVILEPVQIGRAHV